MTKTKEVTQHDGQRLFEADRARALANPVVRAAYEDALERKDLWLQLVEAREAAGLTQVEVAKRLGVSQAQVSRLEKQGYEAYTLSSLRRYLHALGEEFSLDVRVNKRAVASHTAAPAAH